MVCVFPENGPHSLKELENTCSFCQVFLCRLGVRSAFNQALRTPEELLWLVISGLAVLSVPL